MFDIIEDLELCIFKRMEKPTKKLEKNENFKKKKQDHEILYNFIYKELSKLNSNMEHRLEDLIIEEDSLNSTYECLYYITGFLDGVKISKKI